MLWVKVLNQGEKLHADKINNFINSSFNRTARELCFTVHITILGSWLPTPGDQCSASLQAYFHMARIYWLCFNRSQTCLGTQKTDVMHINIQELGKQPPDPIYPSLDVATKLLTWTQISNILPFSEEGQ